MSFKDWRDLRRRLLHVLEPVVGELPARDEREVRELVDAGEYGVAFETLRTQLYEYDVAVPRTVHDQLSGLGQEMRVDRTTWESLEVS